MQLLNVTASTSESASKHASFRAAANSGSVWVHRQIVAVQRPVMDATSFQVPPLRNASITAGFLSVFIRLVKTRPRRKKGAGEL